MNLILEEIHLVLSSEGPANERELVDLIHKSHTVVLAGAGRVGLNAAGFAKRLGHLGKSAYFIQDHTLPRVSEQDLLLIVSGSGETPSLVLFAEIASKKGVPIGLVTSAKESQIGRLADVTVQIDCPSEEKSSLGFISTQPMTTLFEQVSHLYLDKLVLELMELSNSTGSKMRARHNELE